MKFDDIVLGAILLAVAAAATLHAQDFPMLGGLPYGPDLFPTMIGVGLGTCGIIMMVQGVWRRRTGRADGEPWLVRPEWWTDRWLAGNLLAVLAVVVAYIFLSDELGFHLTAIPLLFLLLCQLRVTLRWAAPIGVLFPIVMHLVFYDILRVPLPWGLLTPIAW